jgi:hypothetical protein
MATFRPYTTKEIRDAANAYGVDPDFAEAVYAAESSRGTDPRAMSSRVVRRKRDTTMVRGPFQLEDGTVSDLIRNEKLGAVNVDDPDTHLDLAMRQMRKLQTQFGGDLDKMSQAYLGGAGSVGTNNRDELGTSVGAYSNKILAEVAKLKNGRVPDTLAADSTRVPSLPSADEMDAMLMPEITPFNSGASLPADDMFGIPEMTASTAVMLPEDNLLADGGGAPSPFAQEDKDLRDYIAKLADEEFAGKDFAHA